MVGRMTRPRRVAHACGRVEVGGEITTKSARCYYTGVHRLAVVIVAACLDTETVAPRRARVARAARQRNMMDVAINAVLK